MAKKKSSPWISTADAARELGVSAKFLLRQRNQLFKKNQHWRSKNPLAWRQTYLWHIKRCEEHLERLMDQVE